VDPGRLPAIPACLVVLDRFRIDYRYISDQSSDSTKSFSDHVVIASLIYRFDPTQNFWSQVAAGRTR
jgi:hypothetical protein